MLREYDLDQSGHFVVGEGFEVFVSTTMERKNYMEFLRNSIPMPRLQAIAPTSLGGN